MFDGVKKKDLNFLKSSGFTKKQRMKASAGFLMILLVIAVIGGMGGYTLKLWMDNGNIDRQIASLEAAINDPDREPALAEYLSNSEILKKLKEDNDSANRIKTALENKFRMPFEVIDIVFGELKRGAGDDLDAKIKITGFEIGQNGVLTINGMCIDMANANENVLIYRDRLIEREGEGAFVSVNKNVKLLENGVFTITCAVEATKEAGQ